MFTIAIQDSLKNVRTLNKQTKCISLRIQQLRELAGASSSYNPTDSANDNNYKHSRTENCALLLLELEDVLSRDSAEMVTLELSLRSQIKQISNPKQRMVLELYYLCGYTFAQVAESLGISERWVHTLHDRAIKSLTVHCSS